MGFVLSLQRNFGYNSLMSKFLKGFILIVCATTIPSSPAIEILQIGDSHSAGYYGTFMKSFLENPGSVCDVPSQNNNVTLNAMGWSSPRHWMDTRNRNGLGRWFCGPEGRSDQPQPLRQFPTGGRDITGYGKSDLCRQNGQSPFQNAIANTNPDLVVMTFSHNSLFYADDGNQRGLTANVHTLLNQLPENSECIFITDPPAPRFGNNSSGNDRIEVLQTYFRNAVESWNQQRAASGKTTCAFVPGLTAHTKTQFNANPGYLNSDRWHMTERGARFFTNDVGQRICQSYMDRFNSGYGPTPGGGFEEPKQWELVK